MKNRSESSMKSSPALFLAPAQATKDLVHTGGAVNDFQKGLLLQIIHLVLATLGLDLVDRRALGDEFGHRWIDDQDFKHSRSPDIPRTLTRLADDLFPPFIQFRLGRRTIKA